MSYGSSDFENNHPPIRSNSPSKINNDYINHGSSPRLTNVSFDNPNLDYDESHTTEYRFAPRGSLDNNVFDQSSATNHDPGFQDYDSLEYLSKRTDPSNKDLYLNSQFFIDDPNRMDRNMYSDNNINLFDLTPDQQLAIRELELRRQQAEFEDDYDYGINFDQILDYDVREKLESLNAQLASEPSPPEPEHRNSKVAFKEELISLVAPAEDYELSESDQEEPPDVTAVLGKSPTELTNEANYPSPIISSEEAFAPEHFVEANDGNSSSNISHRQRLHHRNMRDMETERRTPKEKFIESDDCDENNIVVSRGGQFQLLGQSDMIDSSDNRVNGSYDDVVEDDERSNGVHKPRPISAPATKRNRNEIWSNSQLDSSNSSVRSETNYRTKSIERNKSNIDVPRVDRDLLQRQKEREEIRKKEQREKEELELKNRREMNEKCFNAWLQSKNKISKEEVERKKKEEEEERKQKEKLKEERRTQALEKEKELSKTWEQQKRREEKLREYRIKEMKESIIVHTDVECQKAFREWIKKKRQNHQMKQKEEKQKARITRLAMRQCRKSQNLAQAIHQANTFRYLDFCGYP